MNRRLRDEREDPILAAFIPVSQAARVLGVHPETLRRLYKTGRIPVYGDPGWYRIRLRDVLALAKPNDGGESGNPL